MKSFLPLWIDLRVETITVFRDCGKLETKDCWTDAKSIILRPQGQVETSEIFSGGTVFLVLA